MNSINFANISPNCKACDNYGQGDGEGTIAWSACQNKANYYLQPNLSGGGGFQTIGALTDAITNPHIKPNYNPSQSCSGGSYNGYDTPNQDCQKCFSQAPTQTENYNSIYPWSRPKNYNTLNTSWSGQNPYTLN